jgi:hypothetical protein
LRRFSLTKIKNEFITEARSHGEELQTRFTLAPVRNQGA